MDNDTYFLNLADGVALKATCLRRSVGCILVDDLGHILSTGYNGVARGLPHCNHSDGDTIFIPQFDNIGQCNDKEVINYPNACEGAYAKSGESLDKCEAIHAEQNALLQCPNTERILTAYVTTSPCIHCVKLLMNTSCKRIVFSEEYSQPKAKELWLKTTGRSWNHVKS